MLHLNLPHMPYYFYILPIIPHNCKLITVFQ
nr:MAG TPA: hypothetical protein [Inoviridae sp.]